MKRFTFSFVFAAFIFALGFSGSLNAQSVLDPADPVITYNASAPPTQPASGQIGKWVRTKRLSWNTDSYKAYIYKGTAFRLKFPKTYSTNPTKNFPMIIMFHGRGEAGTIYDNEYQLYHGGQKHRDAVDNGTFDGFVFFMQSGGGWGGGLFDNIKEIVDYMTVNNRLDPFRVSCHGLSLGGDGAWNMMANHPTVIAAGLPMSGTNLGYKNPVIVENLKFTSIWDFQGGLDPSPAPSTSRQVYNAFIDAGGNMKHTVYPTLGHGTWNTAYAEPDFFPYMLRAHKANPWPLYGRLEFCPGDPINITLGVTAGFTSYEWKKGEELIIGANSNTINVTTPGTYYCRILRGTLWSEWSPIPATVLVKGPTVSPTINVDGLASKVLPALDRTDVTLSVPESYASYNWQKTTSSTTLSNTNKLTVNTPGDYKILVTEQFGCSSDFSLPFTVIDANGPNKPDAAINLTVSTLSKTSLKLNWADNPNPAYNETNFEIYQADQPGGPYKLIHITLANILSYEVNNLNPNTSYFYVVRAVNTTAAAPNSSEATGTTASDTQSPTSPTNVIISGSTRNSISLTWTAATDDVGVVGYEIYINGKKSYLSKTTSFTIYDLNYGQTYNFAVKAKDLSGNLSPLSNQVTGQALMAGLFYKYYTFTGTWNALPNFSTLTPVATGMMPTIALTPRTQNDNFAFLWEGYIKIPVTGTYTFRTNSDDGSRLYLGNLGQTTTPYNFSATPLVNNDGLHGSQNRDGTITLQEGIYPIAISFYEQGGGEAMTVSWRTPQTNNTFITIPASAFGDAATIGTAPANPSGLTATALSYNKIKINWKDNSNDETGFEIWRSTLPSSGFATVGTVEANAITYTDSFKINPNTRYYYKIRAIGANGESELIGYYTEANWKFNNNYTDASLNNRAITANGSPTFDAANKQEGTHSILLNATNNRYLTPATVNNFLLEAYSERTVAFWMKSASNTSNRVVFDIGGSDDGLTAILNNSTLRVGVASNNVRKELTIPYTSTAWNHIAVVYKGRSLKVYQNGSLVVEDNNLAFTGITTTTNGPRIGATNSSNSLNQGSTSLFNGNIDDFGIYNSGLDAEAILALYNGTFAQSNALSGALPTVPGIPTNLIASALSTSSVDITWSDNSNNESGYKLYRSANDNANYVLLSTLPSNSTNFVDNDLFANAIYYYKVEAFNDGGIQVSNEDSAKTNNNVPVLINLENRFMRHSSQLTINVVATDADTEDLTLQVNNLPPFATFQINGNGSGVINFNPSESQMGTFSGIEVTVTDQNGGIDTKTFDLNVNDNYVPVITPVNNVTVLETKTAQLTFSASDQNAADVLTWNFTGLPSFATPTINGSNVFIDINPSLTDNGSYVVDAVVNDGNLGSSSVQFTITVDDLNPNSKVYLNFTDGTNSTTGPAPWNNLNKVPASGQVTTGFLNEYGINSGIGLTIVSPWQNLGKGTNTNGATTNNNSGIYPDAVMRSAYWTDSRVQTLQITGLDVNNKYSFTFFGSRGGVTDNRTSIYTMKGNSVNLNAAGNTQNTVSINELVPESDGTLTLTLERGTGSSFAYLNAMVIELHYNDQSAPAKPRSAKAEINGGQVKITWVDAAYNESSYEVYKSQDPNGTFVKINTAVLGANTQEYIDGDVTGSSTYYYKILAVNEFGSSPYSDLATVTTENTSPNLSPIANVNMVTNAVLDINISATDDPGDIITLSASGLPVFATLTDNGNGNGILHLDPKFSLGTYSSVTIIAQDNKGASVTRVFTINVTPEDPNAPTNLLASGLSKTSIVLKWTDNSTVETGYEIFRAISSNGTYSLHASVSTNSTTFNDQGIGDGIKYYYKVRAIVPAGYSSFSNISAASRILKQVYINFNDKDPVPAPWNNTLAGPFEGDIYPNLINDENLATSTSMTVVGTGFTGVNNSGMNTGNNSGIYPDDVMKQSWWLDRGNYGILRIDGLNLAMTYNFTFFASRNGNGLYADRNSTYTIGDKSVTLNAINNISQTVQLTDIRPDEDGGITITIEAGGLSPYAYIGSLIIQSFESDNSSEGDGVDLLSGMSNAFSQPGVDNNLVLSSVRPSNSQVIENDIKISAYPNPFKDEVNLTFDATEISNNVNLRIIDVNGKITYTRQLNSIVRGRNQIRLQLDGRMQPGIYFVQIVGLNGNKPTMVRLIKK